MRIWMLSGVLLLTGCGSNFNSLFNNDAQENAADQLILEGKYEYDKGNYDKSMALAEEVLSINRYFEEALILKSFNLLSKAGLDGINITSKLADQSTATTTGTTTTTQDKTSSNFDALKTVMNIQESDFAAMATETTFKVSGEDVKIYLPDPASEARAGGSLSLTYLNQALAVLCPLIADAANPPDDADGRHTCDKSPYPIKAGARSNFAWALAHLGEAITFYSVILYDNGNGVPNLQEITPSTNETLKPEDLLTRIAKVNSLMKSIFPTEEAVAADSMLNALFSDLKTTATALGAIPGIPTSVTKSINDSIVELDARINSIGGAAGAGDVSTQNQAIKDSLTGPLSTELAAKIDKDASKLDDDQKVSACCLYQDINPDASKQPATCSAVTTSAVICAQEIAKLETSPP